MAKKVIALLLATTNVILLSGCWDHVEVSDMIIIAGIGLDIDEDHRLYKATMEIVNAETDSDNIVSEIVEGEGETVYAAIQNATVMTGGAMFSNHCKVIVIGDRLARRGINEIIDMILRSPGFRKTVDIFVAQDVEAGFIIKQKTVKSDIVSYALGKMLKSNRDSLGNTVGTGAYKLHETILSGGYGFVTPTVYAKENNGEPTLRIEGGAVFTGDALRGYLTADECKLLNIVGGGFETVTLPVYGITPGEEPLRIKLTKSKTSFHPDIEGETWRVGLELIAEATLEGASPMRIDINDPAEVDRIEKIVAERLAYDIDALFIKSRDEYSADIFELYRQFEDSFRQEWQTLEGDWREQLLKTELEVSADVRIFGSGLLSNYAPEDDAKGLANALP